MDIAYCEKWWIGRNKPITPLSAESARRRHEAREPYVAVIGGTDHPQLIVDLADVWVSVVFLDQKLRQFLRYDFKEAYSSRLFLKSACYWEYDDESDAKRAQIVWSFDEAGHVIVEERNFTTDEALEHETIASVDENWDRYPDFGDYLYLCREDRSIHGQR